jgi:glycerophosphoryl diester phosphodiesterase
MIDPRPLWPYPRIIAHRGAASLLLKTPWLPFGSRRNLGFVAVEFDVKLTGMAFQC